MKLNSFFLLLLFSTIASQAQSLKLEDIMKGDAFIGAQPENPRWSLDGQKLYFDWNPKNEPGSSTYYWKKGMKSPELTNPKEADLSHQSYIPNTDKSIYYYINIGTLYAYNAKTTKTSKLFQQLNSSLSNLKPGSEKGCIK